MLPGKRYVGQLSSDFILERRRQLQEYLDELLADVTFAHSPPVLHFLQVSFFCSSPTLPPLPPSARARLYGGRVAKCATSTTLRCALQTSPYLMRRLQMRRRHNARASDARLNARRVHHTLSHSDGIRRWGTWPLGAWCQLMQDTSICRRARMVGRSKETRQRSVSCERQGRIAGHGSGTCPPALPPTPLNRYVVCAPTNAIQLVPTPPL